ALDDADVVVVTGGASVGERDLARAMFAPSGLSLLVDKVAMKPGKPVWIGRCGDRIVVGLPGNPTSAMVTARLLLAPLVAGMAGRDAQGANQWRTEPLAADLPCCGDRETFVRAARLEKGINPLVDQDAAAQAPLAHCDVLLRRLPGAAAKAAGEPVLALTF
ncbi:MAG TPA: molybdopterin-binding protein, partial [Phenylobacterium sp.]